MPEGETEIGLFSIKEGTWEVSGQIGPGLKSVLSLCKPTEKLVFTVITEIVNFWGGWHHNLSRFLSPLSDTKTQDPCKQAPSMSVVKSKNRGWGVGGWGARQEKGGGGTVHRSLYMNLTQ